MMMAANSTVDGFYGRSEIAVTVNSSGNATNHSYDANGLVTSQKDLMVTLTVPAIMFASGVFGNILAILVLSRSSKEHKQTVFYRLVGALAVTDLFGTCATSPITLAVYANNLKWVGGHVLCEYEGFMLVSAGFSTILIIGGMAVDRFVAIRHPFFYNQHVSARKAKYFIITIWLIAILMGSLPLIGLGDNIKQFPGTWCFFTFTSRELKNQIYAYLYASTGLFMIGVTAVSNVFVTLLLLKMRRKAIRTLKLSNTKRHDSELQMMILLLGIIVIFSTCWGPFMIRIIINQINFKQVDVRADLYVLRLASLNQILDPWIYILLRKELFSRVIQCFKDSFAVLCRCNCVLNSQRSVAYKSESSHRNRENEFSENSQMMDRVRNQNDKEIPPNWQRSSKKSLKSSSMDSPEDRAPPLRREKGRSQQALSLKHTACLFCFSNHPKSLVLSSVSESKSIEGLKLLEDHQHNDNCNSKQSCETCRTFRNQNNISTCGSIHLSLGDVRTDMGCSCINHTVEQTTPS